MISERFPLCTVIPKVPVANVTITTALPPGGGACYLCSRRLYKDSKGLWHYVEFMDGHTRARHTSCTHLDIALPLYDDPDIAQDIIDGKWKD